jgi:glycosyltransferase involved in cell wall biosynthesis
VCAVSFKECWRDGSGQWASDGGFPLQMSAIASLFDEMTLLTVASGSPRAGGVPLGSSIRVVALPAPRGVDLRRKLSVAWRLPAYLRRFRAAFRDAEVVHVPLPGDIPLVALVTAVAMRRRLIARYGGSWEETSQTTFFNRVTRAILRWIAGGRNVVLATGEGVPVADGRIPRLFATALSEAELARIPQRGGAPNTQEPRLVYAGRLSPEKGLTVLFAAVRRLVGEPALSGLRLAVCGDGPQRAELERLARDEGIASRVEFLGQLDRDRLSAELSRADLCVQPSLTEGFSKAWLDAMAHGLPIVASRVGAAPAVIGSEGERGWLVPPGDPQVLADTLRKALTTTSDWEARRARCRRFAEARTLEAWSAEIARHCVERWGVRREGGKLRA